MKPRARAVLARAAGERAASLVQRLAHLLQPPINASLLGRANQCSLYVSNKQTLNTYSSLPATQGLIQQMQATPQADFTCHQDYFS